MAQERQQERYLALIRLVLLESVLLAAVLLLVSGVVAVSDVQALVSALLGYTLGRVGPATAQTLRNSRPDRDNITNPK